MSRIHYSELGAGAKLPDSLPTPRTIPEVGRIAVGLMVTPEGGKPRPTSTDYFVVRSNNARLITDRYGEKPTELPIFFYSNLADEVCPERLEIRDSARRLFGYGDGVAFSIFNKDQKRYVDYSAEKHPDIMARTAAHLGTQWIPTLTMRFAIKDVPILGYWQFSTHGTSTSIANLRDRFDACLNDLGMVQFLPFMLTVKKVKSNKPGDSRQYPVVDLVPQISIETGLKLGQFMRENPGFKPAELARFSPDQLASPESTGRLLLGGGTSDIERP